MSEVSTIPLFPLNTVLFPNMPLPLHIFEPRYKALVRDCLENKTDFGVLLVHRGHLYQNGTCARIENILERFDDGRLNILTLGKNRFRVLRTFERKPYLEAEVEFWDDPKPAESAIETLFQEVRKLLKMYAKLTGKMKDAAMYDHFSAYSFSFFLAEINMYSLPKQQEILEMKSTEERMKAGMQSLEFLVNRIQLDQKLQKLLGDRHSFFNIYN